jgi:hypothetical protein
VGTITASGIQTFTGVPDTNLLSFILEYNTDVVLSAVCATPVDNANDVCDYTSNVFKVADLSGVCTILVGIANNSTGFGFDYTNFLPQVRIEAKLRQSSYKGERVAYKDSLGNRRVAYFDATKYMNFATGQLPEYLHDFLRLSIGADIVEFDTVNYYVEDEEWVVTRDNSQDEYGYANVVVAKNNQNVKNINCQSSETDSDCGGTNLLLEDNEVISL